MDIDPGRYLGAVGTLDQIGDATGELDAVQPARHLSERIGQDLSVLPRDRPGQLFSMLINELPQPKEHTGPRRE